MITIKVRFLGPAKDMAGAESTTLTLADNAQLDGLRAELTARFPKISAALPTVRFAVNQEFVVGDLALKDGDEVAVIPPVSGGEETNRTWVELVDEAIPVARVRTFVTGDPSLGAITTFEAATRDDSHDLHDPQYKDKRGAVSHSVRHEAFHAGQLATIRRLLGKAFLR